MTSPRPPFDIWVKLEDITPFFFVQHHPFALSLLLRIDDSFKVDIFHFDSDENIFCVFSQYIDDLMLLAKMLRAACNDEKSMCNYLAMGFKENE